ncbi:MAG: GNAT family N-acetyltransferase [Halanaerobiales bacterium]|nr:GNAT family N-acetyltransferase [Halanaerobiales bacterium]
MKYSFEPITIKKAKIIKNWRYSGYIKKIYMDPYFKSYEEGNIHLKGPGDCEGFVVYNKDQEIIGLFEYYLNDYYLEIGLALSPSFVGKKLSYSFLIEGLKFGIKNYNYKKEYIKLSVNKKNLPAFKIYKKAGFEILSIDGGECEMQIKTNKIK